MPGSGSLEAKRVRWSSEGGICPRVDASMKGLDEHLFEERLDIVRARFYEGLTVLFRIMIRASLPPLQQQHPSFRSPPFRQNPPSLDPLPVHSSKKELDHSSLVMHAPRCRDAIRSVKVQQRIAIVEGFCRIRISRGMLLRVAQSQREEGAWFLLR
jgi:hypothetical protein